MASTVAALENDRQSGWLAEEKSMTDADSIWKGKLSRLQDPNLEKMKPPVELMGELRERRQERG
jgi:hypothetical protein